MNELSHVDDTELLPQGSQVAWARVKARLRAVVGEDAFSAYCSGLKLEQILGEMAILSVASSFNHKQVTGPYFEMIFRGCQTELSGIAQLKIVERKMGKLYQPLGIEPKKFEEDTRLPQ